MLLLGPRMTGKSFLLRQLDASLYVDLLDPSVDLLYKKDIRQFGEVLASLKRGSTVIVDEIQRVPKLLDYVQLAIERFGLRFVLSGSSARKLRRGAANLLAGRAILARLHALSTFELAGHFSLDHALMLGTLPKVSDLVIQNELDEARAVLRTYVEVYLRQEIQDEGLLRQVGPFYRFLETAAQHVAQAVVYTNIGAAAAVPRTTVATYFDMLEDTLIATRLWEYGKSEKDKSKPKLFFFDCGVVNALRGRLQDPPDAIERGHLFENFMFQELVKIRDYQNKPHQFSYWQSRSEEIDLLVQKSSRPLLAIEVKSSRVRREQLKYPKFRAAFPKVPIVVASLHDLAKRTLAPGLEVWPWRDVLQLYTTLG
jgi:predicted AAA+ superfamily ATPase